MKKLFLIVLALSPLTTLGANPRWEEAGAAADHTTYFDYATLKRNGPIAQVRTLQDYKATQDTGFGAFSATVELMEFSCERRQSRIAELAQYAGPMGTGRLVKNLGKNPSPAWEDVKPGSVNDRNLNYACNPAAAKAKRAGLEPVRPGFQQEFAANLNDTCMRQEYMKMITADAKASGKPVPAGMSAASLPLQKMRAGVQADPAIRVLDRRIAAGCQCQVKPTSELMASVKTEAEMKAATAQIAKMPQDPRVVKHFEQCWASANAEG